ncbi:unnamed protein product [Euphydryas editha]|uniref:trypsin n=1 Tax=Euphydryas editha TaxID=104508 RepID=A0AAU9UW16_EUPED|nr:unnamed protein product [Euphydryas editha]
MSSQDDLSELCSFVTTDPVVCCLDNARQTTYKPPVATTPRPTTKRPRTTTEPPVYDYVFNDNTASSDDGCEPIASNLTAAKTGQKAWDKCIEYQHKLIYPCERGVALSNQKGRARNCNHKGTQLIVGGEEAAAAEFPHMVLLGLEKGTVISWVCGGTLISERFILTAGHCTSSSEYGKVRYGRTGVLKRTDSTDSLHVYVISNIIKHPQYKPPSRYNDIALLKTDRDIILDQFVVPACLDVGSPNSYERALASGWGSTSDRGDVSDILQKVTLEKFSSAECSDMFGKNRRLEFGFDVNTQICYGDKNERKDTCQGDSGGPLQLYHQQIHCMYTVVGVTSFGRKCGYIGEPGVYTRVASYVPWIESIVWP